MFDRGDGRPIDPTRLSKRSVGLGTLRDSVSDLLGHATVGFTLSVYTHPNEQEAAAAMAEDERLIGGPTL